MKFEDLKKQKYLLHVICLVGILASVFVLTSFIGGSPLLSDNVDGLDTRQDYLGTIDDVIDPIQLEEESIGDLVDDITQEEKNISTETKTNDKDASIKTEAIIQEGIKEENEKKIEEPKGSTVVTPPASPVLDLSPITSNQYVVKANDTLFHIAQRANVTVQSLKGLNNLTSDEIKVGQVIIIKESNTANTTSPSREVASRGSREDDLYWLSRIIHAEAQGEPYIGKVAVGNVILNRVKSSDFPNTIYGVVFDRQYGYTQFSPVLDGSINNTPNADSIRAAQEALNGGRPVGDALYFLNPRKATNFWIVHNRRFQQTIGDHDFYY